VIRNAVFSVLVFGAFGCFQVDGSPATFPLYGQAFLLNADDTFTLIPATAQFYSAATGINNSGQVVGVYEKGSIFGYEYSYSNFSFVTTPIWGSGINDAGVIVGGAVDTNGVLSYIDIGQSIGDALGINDLGQIVGWYYGYPEAYVNGFLDTNGAITTINFPGAYMTMLFGINDLGEIVGTYSTTYGGPDYAFVYNNASSRRSLFPAACLARRTA
jgi:probable HAF family extracellular repeat protein